MSSLFSVNGKIALVTGGTSGIGYMIAQGLVKHGAKVYVASRKAEACANTAEALSAFGTCIGIPADLSTEQGCVDLVNEIQQREGRLNILVNNAGVTWGAPLEQYPADAWDKIQNLNVKSAFVMTQKSLPMLEAAASAADPARVINITSVAGQMYGSMQAYAYGPSKAALNHLTKILAGELAAKHITVNAIAPGVFPSRMTTFVLKDEKMAEQQRNAVPLGRLGEPEDMEGLAVFLSSQAGAYITGNVIALDGGTAVKSPDIL
ncbi:MAG: 3-oxoacyl-ACP reductase [Pseudomonadales bacterium]|jgi:NAD(P)-dependent dehydrogenase (short-subunit alcohol dehydrogenase family)|uniref:SDR family oxidoreductase n=1 Tax=unclassified Ketobacter TaxID=2639109 RepID=UPI000C8EA0D0|nr:MULTISPECIES: SDR family oxidoreductase [unclassified Ketobacter]MAQ25150.1 3-oxoacyl-ACP reductase [Pseudomonadales bacterium]MEC8812189.1 SDR family oxidoreductase [Pseudomonadota bacterium]TNC83556.1 MAG: 3-oxoacyl-ACP reductase [Alcanivorax sp.]HAG94746.1 3-oxoacyl-ACP reductase [Gammaproteobacteria bacterium]MCK5789984.1 SDR family oxidoreductase [Ketobacter sp.]|tara:strand:- start:174 stop:962 length:789 start_codon:yes stop_codon:yes gene_type:complete